MKNIIKRKLMNFLSNFTLLTKSRVTVLNSFGMNVSKKSYIGSNCFFDIEHLKVGGNTFINRFCQFHDGGHGESVTIGDNCMVAMNVNFCTVSHELGTQEKGAGKTFTKPITVNSNCWIGANATILPGVTIGQSCVIAAGSVVSKNCEPNGLYAGVPARRIKDLS